MQVHQIVSFHMTHLSHSMYYTIPRIKHSWSHLLTQCIYFIWYSSYIISGAYNFGAVVRQWMVCLTITQGFLDSGLRGAAVVEWLASRVECRRGSRDWYNCNDELPNITRLKSRRGNIYYTKAAKLVMKSCSAIAVIKCTIGILLLIKTPTTVYLA